MNKLILPVLFVTSLVTLFGLSKIRDTWPVEFDNIKVINSDKKTVPLSNQSSSGVKVVYVDEKGNNIFYPSYDVKANKKIWIQFAVVYPAGFDAATYSKPIVILGHDGYDTAQSPNWDIAMEGKLNYLVKNVHRLATPIAEAGSVVIVPTYRGENESDGTIDVAGGDVMDTIGAIRYAKTLLPDSNQSTINLVGTSRGSLTSVMTASVYPVDKVVMGYGVMDMPNWNNNEANCGTGAPAKKCIADREKVYGKYTSWEQILDDDAIRIAKSTNGGKLPKFTRVGININHYANPKTGFYLGQGLNDKSVKPYNSFKMVTALTKLKQPNAIDVYYGTHSNVSEGTHGIYTRVTSNYINDLKGRGAKIDDLKTKFIQEATTTNSPTALVRSPIKELQTKLGNQTLAKIVDKK
jgi:alpha/beta superfamily hydrolase